MEETKKNEGASIEESKSTIRQPISWKAHEYTHFEKTAEWFWALGLIVVSGALIALVYHNLLFSIFILLAGFVLAIFASRHPHEVDFAITQRGIRVDDTLYPFQSLESFGIEESTHHQPHKLIISSKKTFLPNIVIPLENVNENEVHDFLISFLPEEDHVEPLTHKVMEFLGF